MTVDVVIAAAPFLSVARPSLGASALAAAVRDQGFCVSVDYLNMRYAARRGLDFCERIADRCPAHFLIGEWIFAADLNRDVDPDIEAAYRARMADYLGPDLFSEVLAARQDAPAAVDDMARHLLDQDARIYGFTTTFQQNCASLALARRIKTARPDAIIVFGGANCDGPMGAGLADTFPWIDFVFAGEADIAFPAFLEEWRDERLDRSKRVRTGQPVAQMDALPIPDYGDYFDQLTATPYRPRVAEGVLFESARGCWWGAKNHCKFCGLNGQGMAFRAKSADRVLHEIDNIAQAHGVRRFAAADNIMDMRHIKTVFDVLGARGSDISFFYEVKSNLKTDHLTRIAQGGVTWVQPGIESLDNDILVQMGKGVTGLQNIRLLRSCAELGMHPVWNLLCGFPGETAQAYTQMAALMPALAHLTPPTGHSPIRLDRFSPYFERAEELGYRNVRPAPAYRAVFGLTEDRAARIAYFFEGDAEGLPPDGYLQPFIDGIAIWRAEHAQGQTLPDLRIIEMGGVHLIKDTRACAAQPIKVVTPDERVVLDAFREPARVDVVWADASMPANADHIFDDLLERRFVHRDATGHAVSLVCAPDRSVAADAAQSGFPGGFIRPAKDTRRSHKIENARTHAAE